MAPDGENEDVAAQLRRFAEDQQMQQMQDQARQQAQRHANDNAAAERLRGFGEVVPKGKAASEAYLRGAETIAGPTGPTSSQFTGQAPVEPEGDSDAGSPEDR